MSEAPQYGGAKNEIERKRVETDYPLECLGEDQLQKVQTGMIDRFSSAHGIRFETSRAILRASKWDWEAAAEATATNGYREASKYPLEPLFRNRRRFTCTLCYEGPDSRETIKLKCGDIFCLACHKASYEHDIRSGTLKIRCPGMCGTLIQDELLEKVVSAKDFIKFQTLQTHYFVACRRDFRWCPAPDCGYALKGDPTLAHLMACRCGSRVCISCKLEEHAPCPCDIARDWSEAKQETTREIHRVAAHELLASSNPAKSKKCPVCSSEIERDGGCKFMHCTQCDNVFDWSYISYTVYTDAPMVTPPTQGNAEHLKYFLKMYNHYEMILKSYRHSKGLPKGLLRSSEDLSLCFNTLKWTFVMGCYLDSTDPKFLFKDKDLKLKHAIKQVVAYIAEGNSHSSCEPNGIVQKAVAYALQKREKLLDFIAGAANKKKWTYST